MSYLESLIRCITVFFAAGGLLLFMPYGGVAMEAVLHQGEKNEAHAALGAILPLSGSYEKFGDRILDSLLLAGGFFDEGRETSVELYLEDSQMKPEKARRALSELADRHRVLAVLGPVSSEESYAAAEEAEKRGISLITLTRNQDVTGVGRYIFNALPSTRNQIRHLVGYALGQRAAGEAAVLYPDVPAGRDAAGFFRDEMAGRGGRVSRFVAYPADKADFAVEVERLTGRITDAERSAGTDKAPRKIPFDALFIPDSAVQVSRIVSQLVFYRADGFQLLGDSGWNMPETVAANRERFEGAIFVDGFFANGAISESAEFADRFYEVCDREADSLDAYIYDAMAMTLQIIEAGKNPTRERLRRDLAGMNAYHGVRGVVTVAPLRIMDSQPFLVTVRDGEFIQIIEP